MRQTKDKQHTRSQWQRARVNTPGSRKATNPKDARVKLTDAQKATIRELYATKRPEYSQRALATLYGVSRRLIQYTIDPEKLAHARAMFLARQKDGRYYNRTAHTQAMRRHRARIREILDTTARENQNPDFQNNASIGI